jgi:isoleucyl-tRNA synthetase
MVLLEQKRQDKAIGKSLDATVSVSARAGIPSAFFDVIKKYEFALAELLNVSRVRIDPSFSGSGPMFVPWIQKAPGTRCERCWRYTEDLGRDPNYPTVCLRCAEALDAIDFPPYAATPQAG